MVIWFAHLVTGLAGPSLSSFPAECTADNSTHNAAFNSLVMPDASAGWQFAGLAQLCQTHLPSKRCRQTHGLQGCSLILHDICIFLWQRLVSFAAGSNMGREDLLSWTLKTLAWLFVTPIKTSSVPD
jgi:hypothetical protein